RMLEIEEGVARTPEERRSLLEQIVELRLGDLADPLGAFETLSELVLLDPSPEAYRPRLQELAVRASVEARRADILVTAAEAAASAELRAGLFNEAARVARELLGDPGRASDLYRRVLGIAEVPRPAELEAAQALSELLREGGEAKE